MSINNYDNKQTSLTSLNGMGGNLLYFLVGGGIGATVALLFAPKPGRELRQDATEVVKQGLETANKTVSQLKGTADDYYHKAQDKATELYRVAFKAASDGTQEARDFADKTFDHAQELINQASPEKNEQASPMFESGRKPGDQGLKPGIL